jgi:peptidoglycan/LPS O-acetylase OafA/YrhL
LTLAPGWVTSRVTSDRPSEAALGAPPKQAWHSPALDGIRAVAVIAVLMYHAGVTWFGGGMLGVDMFFALSGFLITTLLVNEHQSTGTLALVKFYGRRARRLLPALFLLLVLVAAYAARFAEPDTVAAIRGDSLATLTYVSNWHFILSDQGYFVHFGAPSPLLHTWSLAIEEQFYLVWPMVVLIVLKRYQRRALALVAALGALASVALTWGLFLAGESVNRLYYGTDTRAQAVMVGACLGALGPLEGWFSGRPGWTGAATARRVITGVGLLGGAVCIWAIHAVSGTDTVLYHGGFALMALATTAVIAVVIARPEGLEARLLSVAVLGYLGRISYGLYLYHWPLFLMIDNAHTGLVGWQLLVVRLAATLAVAAASYHLVELPIRQRRFLKGWQLTAALPAAAIAVVVALVVATEVPVAAVPTTGTLAPPPAAYTASLAHTYGLAPGRPVRVLVLGDSMALTLGMGLGVDAKAWDVQVVNQGVIGCDLDPSSTVNIQTGPGQAAQGCVGWQRTWADDIQRFDPDVVLIELGRWEVSDRIVDGRWSRIGSPPWDDLLGHLLDQAVTIVTEHGSKAVLCTLPYIRQTTEQPNGQPWAINLPIRTDQYNAVVHRVVARHPAASVMDLNRLLDPAGHYTSYIDGIRVRNDDDEHPSVAGGELIRPEVLPGLVALGAPRARVRP